MRTSTSVVLGLSVLPGIAGCDDEDEPDEEFIAHLTGAAERPNPVDTDASGTARFEREGEVVSFTLDVSDIDNVIAAHIHGPAGVNDPAGVIVTLFDGPQTGPVDGRLADGSFRETEVENIDMDSLLVLMREGQTYVNVHTSEHPPGEIRGQILVD